MTTMVMEYLVILFSPSSPTNLELEVDKIANVLHQQENVCRHRHCKIKAIARDVGDVNNTEYIQASMIHLLRTEASNPLDYDIFTTGYYAPTKEYAFFQASYAIAKDDWIAKNNVPSFDLSDFHVTPRKKGLRHLLNKIFGKG